MANKELKRTYRTSKKGSDLGKGRDTADMKQPLRKLKSRFDSGQPICVKLAAEVHL